MPGALFLGAGIRHSSTPVLCGYVPLAFVSSLPLSSVSIACWCGGPRGRCQADPPPHHCGATHRAAVILSRVTHLQGVDSPGFWAEDERLRRPSYDTMWLLFLWGAIHQPVLCMRAIAGQRIKWRTPWVDHDSIGYAFQC